MDGGFDAMIFSAPYCVAFQETETEFSTVLFLLRDRELDQDADLSRL